MKTVLYLFVGIIVFAIILIAVPNVAEIKIQTAFGTIISSVFVLVLFSFILGAFCMFLLHLVNAGQEEKRKVEKAEEIASPYFKTAFSLYAHAHYDAALKDVLKIKNIASSPDALVLKIKCLLKTGKSDEAFAEAELARSSFPDNIEVVYMLAGVYNRLGLVEKVKETLQSIITLEPRNSYKAYLNLRDLFIRAGNWIDAIKTHGDMVYHFPSSVDNESQNIYYGLCYRLATQFMESRNYREALHYAKEIQDVNEQFSLSYYVQAKVYFLLKDENNFTKTISKGISKTRNYALMKLMEDFYLAEFNPRAAIELYKNLIYETRKDKMIMLAFGLYYQRLEMIEEAVSMFQQLHGQYPKWYELSLLKGQLFLRLQEKDKALENFEAYFTHYNLPALFTCHKCGNRTFSYSEKCSACNWWDSINLTMPAEEETSIEPILWAESII